MSTKTESGGVERIPLIVNSNIKSVHSTNCSPQMENDVAITSLEQLLRSTSFFRPFPLIVTMSMASMWGLCALSLISVAFTASDTSTMGNFTFHTIQQEFGISSSSAELTTSIYFVGNFLFGQWFATFADHIGRRPVILASLMLSGLSGCLGALAPSFPLFLVARFFQGTCFTPLTTVTYVLVGESLSDTWQSLASFLFGFSWVVGYCLLAPLAIRFPDWQQLQFFTSAPNIVFALVLFFILPESIAYLVENSNPNAIEQWIHSNEKWSCGRRPIPHDIAKIMEHNGKLEQQEVTLLQMLANVYKDLEIRRVVVIETFIWIFTFLMYCALALTSTSVGKSDPIVSFLFSGIVELPAYIVIPILLKWAKRRTLRFVSYSLGVAANFVTYFLLQDTPLQMATWLMAKFSAACCYLLCFVYASEAFPIYCRSCCVGICSTMYNLGAIFSPTVFQLNSVAPNSQFLLLSLVGVVCILLSRLQPETKKKS